MLENSEWGITIVPALVSRRLLRYKVQAGAYVHNFISQILSYLLTSFESSPFKTSKPLVYRLTQ